MTFYAKAGTLTADATGTGSATQTVSGLGFTPKAIIMWAMGRTATGWGAAADLKETHGISDGTTHYCVSLGAEDNSATTDANRRTRSKVCSFMAFGGTVEKEATIAFASGQFTLTWTTNDTNAYLIHYLVIGGTDVSSKVMEFTAPASAGDGASTGVGFQPTFGFFLANNSAADDASANSSGGVGYGAVDQSGNQWMYSERTRSNNAAQTSWRYQRTDSCLAWLGNASESQRASWVSWDADGFTLNYQAATSGTAMWGLFLSGLKSKVGSFSKGTGGAPASQSVTGVGFTPVAVALSTFATTATTSITTSARHSFGAMDDAGNEASGAQSQTSGLNPGNQNISASSTKAIQVNDANAASSEAEADYTSMDSDGFTLSWSTNNGTAHQILYLAIAQSLTSLSIGGTLTTVGSLVKQVQKALAATLTSSGLVKKDITLPATTKGTLTSAGAVQKALTPQPYPGALTLEGELTVSVPAIITRGGTLGSAGRLKKDVSITEAGTQATAGTVTKSLDLPGLAGELTTEGALDVAVVTLLTLEGTLTTAGAIVKSVARSVGGSLSSSAGVVIISILRGLRGTLSTAGTVQRDLSKNLAGTMATNGALAILRTLNLSPAGTLTTAGAIAQRALAKTFRGTLGLAGELRSQGPAQFGMGPARGAATFAMLGIGKAAKPLLSRGAATLRTLGRGAARLRRPGDS